MLNDIAEDQKTREKERGRYVKRKKEIQRQQAKTGGGKRRNITKNEKGFSIILKKMRLHDMQIIVRMDDVHCL